ncbi:MAG: hypothetical protein ACXAEU_04750 [Candidatus Hodarchaeales archaeon]|jgi:chromosome segregation ATPase
MSKQAKIMIIKQVKEAKETKKQQYSLQVDGFTKTVSSNPRAAYNLQDLLAYFDQIKGITLKFLDKTFRDFSTLAIRSFGNTSGTEPVSMDDLIDSEEGIQLRERIRELEERLASSPGANDTDIELTIQELRNERENWKNKFEGVTTKLQEYEEQTKNLNIQLNETSDNFRDRITEYMEELNDVQAEADELRRSNEKLNLQIDEIGKVMMTSEQEKDSLKGAIAERDKTIRQLNEKMVEYESVNDTLKGNVLKAAEKIKQLKEEIDAKSTISEASPDVIRKIEEIKEQNKELEEEIEELTKENQMLLEDTGSTSQAAKTYKEEIETMKRNLKNLSEEKESLETRYKDLIEDVDSSIPYKEEIETMKRNLKNLSEEKENLETRHKDLTQETELLKSKIDEEIIKAEKAIADKETTNRDMISIKYELERTEKDLEANKALVKQLTDELDASTGAEFQIENKEREINRFKKQVEALEDARNREKSDFEELLKKSQESVNQEKDNAEKLNDKIQDLEGEIEGFKERMVNLRQYLEENPRYAILFLIQDLRRAKIGEIQKALSVAPQITLKLVRALENEGWVKITETETEMEVEILKDFIPD